MRGVHWFPFAGLVLACGGQPESQDEVEAYPDSSRTLLTVEELPPMPSYPKARGGRLVTESAGDYDLSGVWKVRAGLCADIDILEIYAGPSGLRSALLLHMLEGDQLRKYPVVAANANFPDAPAALIAVQAFAAPEAFGFQAYTGELELSVFGERVSGRFVSTLREIGSVMLTQYVGVFEGISVEPLLPDYCQAMQDSTLSSDSTTAADSASVEDD